MIGKAEERGGAKRGITWVVEMLDEPVLENGQCFCQADLMWPFVKFLRVRVLFGNVTVPVPVGAEFQAEI